MAGERQVAVRAVQRAMALLAGPLPGKPPTPVGVRTKAPHDYVTDLDLACEREISAIIRAAYPTDSILGEEEERASTRASRLWMVDPVDGTRNLVGGRPDVAVSVAFAHEGRLCAAALGLPYRGLLLSADAEGAWLGDEPLPPLVDPPEGAGLIGLTGELRVASQAQKAARLVGFMVGRAEGIRISGALAYDLATLALGELHGRFSYGGTPWDIAAGALLIERLGGVVSDPQGRPWTPSSTGVIAASGPRAHALLVQGLKAVQG